MNYKTHTQLSTAVAAFCEEYNDHPLLKDTAFKLKQAMYELDTMLMSPGEKVVASYYDSPAGQEPVRGNTPHSQ